VSGSQALGLVDASLTGAAETRRRTPLESTQYPAVQAAASGTSLQSPMLWQVTQ
jgi:hypothetical protein